MAFERNRRTYESLPLVLKRCVGLVPFSWIAGPAYWRTLARASRFERATREDIQTYQARALGEILRFATDQVPAYRRYDKTVKTLPPFEALKQFPLLDKDVLQENLEQYLPRDFDRIPHHAVTTGGTTGSQLKFYVDDTSQSVEIGFMHRQWKRVGYSPRCRKATFRGVLFPNLRPGVYWQRNPIYNEMQFSPFHMNEDTLGAYTDQLVRFCPDYLHGYPSAVDMLSDYVLRNGLRDRMPRPRAALLGSEGLLPGQRERIENAFRTRVFSWYGHSERVVMAGECERTQAYHHFPDYGILELVAEDGSACGREGDRGEVVGTGLLNRSLPLIRYRTGDYAVRLDPRCECGREWDRFAEVQGRWKQEMLIGRHGAKISIAALNMHGPIFDRVVRYQYCQEKDGVCELRVMVSPDFGERDRCAIENAYRSKVHDELDVAVRVVDDIPLTARGKLKILDSRIPQGV